MRLCTLPRRLLFIVCSSERVLGRFCVFFFQAEDGIRDLVRSRGLGDVYKRQLHGGGGVVVRMAGRWPGHG